MIQLVQEHCFFAALFVLVPYATKIPTDDDMVIFRHLILLVLHPMMLDAKDLGAGTAAAVLYAASTSSYPRKMFRHAAVRMLCIMLIQDE